MKFKWVEKKSRVSPFSLASTKINKSNFNRIIKILDRKFLLSLLLVFLILCAFTAGIIAQRNFGFSNMIAKPIILDTPGILKRKFFSYFSNPEILKIDLKYENHLKLMFNRENSIIAGTTRGVENEWIKATVHNSEKLHNAKIRLKGAIADQHLADEKWSFRLKLKKDETIFGMREFSVMDPTRRNFLGQWFIRKAYEKEGLITRKYNFIKLILNGEDKGIYVIDERYDKIMLERNHRKEGPVMKVDTIPLFADKVHLIDYDNYYLSMDLTAFDLDNILKDDLSREQFFSAKNLMEKFRLGQIRTSEVFDIKLLAKWTAISDVMGAWHGFSFNNMRFYYNPITSKFEPVPDDDFNEKSLNYVADFRLFRLNDLYNNSIFLRNIFSDHTFVEEYMKQLVRISDDTYLDNLFLEFNNEIIELSNILAKDYPLYNFLLESKSNIYSNASRLRDKFNYHKGIQAHIKNLDKKGIIELSIANNHSIPMEVLFISDKDSKIYNPLIKQEPIIINNRKYMEPVVHSSHLFEFATNNNFLIEDLSKLKITYRIVGTKKLFSTEIFPYKSFDSKEKKLDFIRKDFNVSNFSFLDLDKINNEIKFKKGDWKISEDIIVPPNHKLIIPEGVNLDLINSAMILSYSPLSIVGSKENYIKIFSSDNSGQGITLINAKKASLIKYVKFKNLSNPIKSGFELSGSINFYKSPVHMHETHFNTNANGDDYINIIRSNFSINDSSILNSYSDAIDIDFSNGNIKNSKFLNCGFDNNNGDCIDLSGSIVSLDKIYINKASDKGISIGEKSFVDINDTLITGSNIGIANKDFSETVVSDLTINSTNIGVYVFKKKPEFGPASVIINGLDIKDVAIPYKVEDNSFLSINSKIIK